LPPDVSHRQIVRIRKNIRRKTLPPQRAVNFDHRRHGRKDVAEEFAELVGAPAKAGGRADRLKKLSGGHPPQLVLRQQRPVLDEKSRCIRSVFAFRGDPARGDGIIEIHQDLAEIEDNNFWNHEITKREQGWERGMNSHSSLEIRNLPFTTSPA